MENNNTQTQRPYYLNLWHDGDSAVVRILHSSTKTIEKAKTHRIDVDGKHKRIKCLETDCPLCQNENVPTDKIYLHVFDYSDNTEKVWERTDKIIPQLEAVEKSWAPLDTAVLKITRKGEQFPQYSIEIQNPMAYAPVAKELIDKPLAKMYFLSRKKEDIEEFLSTGKFPERKPFLPKEEYRKLKEAEKAEFREDAQSTNIETNATFGVSQEPDFDDPFMDSFSVKPRKV